jgi:hypothetical protein
MSYEIIVRAEAEEELNSAVVWYEKQRRGLGNYFLIHVTACFSDIERNPNQYALVYKEIRMAVLRRFPYSVYYLVDDKTIRIIGILHHKRNRRKILRRRK